MAKISDYITNKNDDCFCNYNIVPSKIDYATAISSNILNYDMNQAQMQMLKEMMQQQIAQYMAVPPAILLPSGSYLPQTSTSKTGSVTIAYPITFNAYKEFHFLSDLPPEFQSLVERNQTIADMLVPKAGVTEDKFIADLKQARISPINEKDSYVEYSTGYGGKVYKLVPGTTYDPWLRKISTHKGTHYKIKSSTTTQIKVGSNSEEVISIWEYKSTIDSRPILIYLYVFYTRTYTNKRKKENHMDSINPYSPHVVTVYDL